MNRSQVLAITSTSEKPCPSVLLLASVPLITEGIHSSNDSQFHLIYCIPMTAFHASFLLINLYEEFIVFSFFLLIFIAHFLQAPKSLCDPGKIFAKFYFYIHFSGRLREGHWEHVPTPSY